MDPPETLIIKRGYKGNILGSGLGWLANSKGNLTRHLGCDRIPNRNISQDYNTKIKHIPKESVFLKLYSKLSFQF